MGRSTSIIVAIVYALLTRRVYFAFIMFTYYDFSLWLEKLAEKYKIISRALLHPCYRCPMGSGRTIAQNNVFWMTMGRKPKQDPTPKQDRKPQQDRSVRSMAKMLDAAEAIFAEGGDNSLTVDAVIKLANTSVGSFYSRFGDRDGLLKAMHERFLLRLGGAAHVAVATAGNEKKLAGAIEVFLSHLFTASQEYRNSARFFVLHRSADPILRAQGIRANTLFAGIFTTLLLSHREEIAHASPATAVDVAWRMLYAVLAQQMMFDDEEVTGVAMATPALVSEVSSCLVAYLKAGSGKH